MENQPQHHHQIQNQQAGNEENGGKGGSYVCRQSSTRWTPTTDQINILKGLYYNSGVRSPTADQIQSITARLRQYGKIEGKNVFYWFQNHKARERQKKRFTTVTDHHHHDVPALQPPPQPPSLKWKQPQDYSCFHSNTYLHNNINSPGISSPSSSSTGRHMGNYGHGSVTMEKNFRDCSISAGVGSMSTNYGWVSSYSSSFDKQKTSNETLEEEDDDDEEQEEEEDGPEIKTLPLFPTEREDIDGFCNIKHNSIRYSHNWYGYGGYGGGFEDGLELSLNSCTGQAPDSL